MKANLTLNTAKQLYKEGGAGRAFALDNFSEKELTGQCWPTSWAALEHINGWLVNSQSRVAITFDTPTFSMNAAIFNTEEQAKASIALAQLSQLLKAYNGDWVPDWNSNERKYVIVLIEGDAYPNIAATNNKFLSFPDEERRDHFLKHHYELINQAKPLL